MGDSAQFRMDVSPEPDLTPDRDDVLLEVPRWDCRSSLCASCTQIMEHISRVMVLRSEPEYFERHPRYFDDRSEIDRERTAAQGCFLCARVTTVLRAYVQGGGDLPGAGKLVRLSAMPHKTRPSLDICGSNTDFCVVVHILKSESSEYDNELHCT